MLEATQHDNSAFVTLTYDDKNLQRLMTLRPSALSGFPSLDPKAHRYWLDRLRKEIGYRQMRYYVVGEYGDETQRPHYHACLFGFATCERGRTKRRPGFSRPLWRECCDRCRLVGTTWGKGDVDLGILETHSAQYVAGYTTKKLNASSEKLFGRYPERAWMSGGIGSGALWEIASELMRYEKLDPRISQGDVPVTLRHGSKELPLGRYLRKKLRLMIGRGEEVHESTIKKMEEELLPLRWAARSSSEAPALREQVEIANAESVRRFESRQRIFKGRKSL